MKNPNSYYVSRHEDFRDAREILTASSHDDAAKIAWARYGMVPDDQGVVHVILDGDARVVDLSVPDVTETVEALL